MQVIKRDGSTEELDVSKVHKCVSWACENLENVSIADVETNAHLQFFDGITTSQIHKAMIQSASELISLESPDYEYVAARLLLQQIVKEVGKSSFYTYVCKAVSLGILSSDLIHHYDFDKLESALQPNNDLLFKNLGMQTVYDRYLIRDENKNVIELPQHFLMRVACGICLNEDVSVATDVAIELYNIYSNFEALSSTPTLFNSGTLKPQMSSCYINTFHDSTFELEDDNLVGIMATMAECALLSKHAGGVGSDFTRIRPAGSKIKGTNGESSGIIPALKIYNDTALFFNQSGKRKGSFAPYLEMWHGDIEPYISLKKPTGDERLRARDIFPYLWISDLFMERVKSNSVWSLFDSSLYPELHTLYGEAFNKRYEELESQGKFIKQVNALELWRKCVETIVETGAPMNTFKDEHNRRNPQKHIGAILSSNLCSETSIVQNDEETAVCNLASINASKTPFSELKRVVPIVVRALDNVIDINFYPSPKAAKANANHRPVGLGVMGWYEYLIQNNIDFESQAHLDECDRYFDELAYWSIRTSVELAKEKGKYSSFEGSEWSKGILPIDTARDIPTNHVIDNARWDELRQDVVKYGLRNSLLLAIAPTATIANILGTTASIEPPYKLSEMKENLSGKFIYVNPSMRYGSSLPKSAFEIDQEWLIRAAAVRQKWLCQAQSLNLFKKKGVLGRVISGWYFLAWELGLKSTYYLKNEINEVSHTELTTTDEAPKFCSITDEGCVSCE